MFPSFIIKILETGKTCSNYCGPISELTNLAAKLCHNSNPAIFLESDTWYVHFPSPLPAHL
jgi:hypothetical protein